MSRRVAYIDVTTRDAHQSLWATRMTNAMILPFVPQMDEIGFDWINLVGGAVFDVCVRYLHEDPWERMRLVAERAGRTPIDVMTRGQSLFTFEFFADDVVEATIRRIRAQGMHRVTIYDALNDTRNLELSAHTAHDEGLYVAGALVYTVSPVHTDEYYAKIAKELVALGANSIMIKDPAGLLRPERVQTLVPALKSVTGSRPLELHSHSLSGLAEYCYMEAVPLGADVLHTAISPLSSGASLPPTEYCVRHLAREGFESRLSEDGLAEMADYFTGVAKREGLPLGVPLRYNPALYRHQVPGGMISNLHSQLRDVGMEDRLDATLEEVEHVRVDLGYPILVSPFAQYVVIQAMLNVVQGERYKTIPVEVQRYLLGHYGKLAAAPDRNLLDRVIADGTAGKEVLTGRPGEHIPPALDRIRRERGPFDSDDDVLLAAFYSDAQLEPLFTSRAQPRNYLPSDGVSPLKVLLTSLAEKRDVNYISIQRPGLRLELRH